MYHSIFGHSLVHNQASSKWFIKLRINPNLDQISSGLQMDVSASGFESCGKSVVWIKEAHMCKPKQKHEL